MAAQPVRLPPRYGYATAFWRKTETRKHSLEISSNNKIVFEELRKAKPNTF